MNKVRGKVICVRSDRYGVDRINMEDEGIGRIGQAKRLCFQLSELSR